MNPVLLYILSQPYHEASDFALKAFVESSGQKISLFQIEPELQNLSVIDYLFQYQKIKNYNFESLLKAGAVNFHEKSSEGYNVVDFFIYRCAKNYLIQALFYGASLTEESYNLGTSSDIQSFLQYQPGSGRQASLYSIKKLCSARVKNQQMIQKVIYDYYDTTDGEDSEIELESFAVNQDLVGLNQPIGGFVEDVCVAARGVHFSPRYFSKQTAKKVRQEKHLKKTTYSQSTLFDSGYTADDDVDENDQRIQTRNNTIRNWLNRIGTAADKKEKKIQSYRPPKTRNDIVFQSLYYRFMQVYINSYSTLFNLGSIQTDFDFDTKNNPMISMSWDFEKACMYGSGARFDWNNRSIKKNPHYRRSTGVPKHPNMGYLDVYKFPKSFVLRHGFDRILSCKEQRIHLSSFYRHEAEIIFVSYVPKTHHYGRYILTLPSFEKEFNSYNKAHYYAQYGIISKTTYDNLKNAVLFGDRNSGFQESLKKITELAAAAQSEQIKTKVRTEIIYSKTNPSRIVYHQGRDHQGQEQWTPFMPSI